ncbi:hypothetical protein PULV_a1847 [Pseudoalteromonas ulvae UL12]|uniref:DUF1315 domain-containing protein n=1 Tax=Pseudoalteromonas ulvae TaxID=107327 RepID=A0A244CN76_PSEDV|nr:DUF1315 family protein [Pseudoalteromonas ulvae]MBE0364248.1 hypothetical protein [Pseudoalteromonas ulvae UL12]OUL57008.1 hypothetical protein B1199_16740 [Pseudoalteromonas ulvae]
MNIEQLVNNITPELYERLQYGAATGKWPDGTPLMPEQRDQAIQAVMLYQAKIEKSEQQFTVGADGHIVQKSKQELKRQFASSNDIARFNQNDI